MSKPTQIWALNPVNKYKKYATLREAVLNDCEFPGSGSWHTLALRN